MNTLKTILYMGSLHGFFTFYLPWQIAVQDKQSFDTGIFHFIALPLWIAGALIIVRCSMDMVRRGHGTPSHLDPPKTLIVIGLYRHIRNPIYLGALFVQLGYIAWFGSIWLIAYFLFFLLAFHLLIVLIEEPVLKNTFDDEYEAYRKNVPRWIPKIW